MKLIAPPQPGVYHDVPADTYHQWDAVSHSWLKLLGKSAEHLRDYLDKRAVGIDISTPTQRLGRGYHEAVADYSSFKKTFVRAGYCVRPIKTGDRKGVPCGSVGRMVDGLGQWYCGTHPIKVPDDSAAHDIVPDLDMVLRPDDYDICIGIRDKIAADPDTAELFHGDRGRNEISMVWDDEETGIRCKARPDRVTFWHWGQPDKSKGWMTHVDIKGTETDRGTREAFGFDTYKWGYYIQAPFYLDGCFALENAGIIPRKARRFVFCVVEKSGHYPISLHELDLPSMDAGRREYKSLLHAFKRCIHTNTWPGRYECVQSVSIPERAM